jgi:hypothetical protein
MLNGVVAVVNSFVGDLSRRDHSQRMMKGEAVHKGIGLCSTDPLATEFTLLFTSILLIFISLLGLPILFLQFRDYCVKFSVKKTSRQLRLKHAAENLRDLRYLTNRAIEEQLLLGLNLPTEQQPEVNVDNVEAPEDNLVNQASASADASANVPPPISVKPKIAGIKKSRKSFDLENLPNLEIDSEGGVLFKNASDSVLALKAGKKALAEEAKVFVTTQSELLERARARVKARSEAEVILKK